MKKFIKLSLLVLASMTVVGCGSNSGLLERIDALEEKVEKSGFYAEKNQYEFTDEVTIYYNQKKLYSINNHTKYVNTTNKYVAISLNLTAYANSIVPANVFSSFFLEWNNGVRIHSNDPTNAKSLVPFKDSTTDNFGIYWDSMPIEIWNSIRYSTWFNLLIAVPGTTVPVTRVTLPFVF